MISMSVFMVIQFIFYFAEDHRIKKLTRKTISVPFIFYCKR